VESANSASEDSFNQAIVRRPGSLNKNAVSVLKAWLFSEEHFCHPYPNAQEKGELALQAGISTVQVANWFANARKRVWQRSVTRMGMHVCVHDNGRLYVKRLKGGEVPASFYPNPNCQMDEEEGMGRGMGGGIGIAGGMGGNIAGGMGGGVAGGMGGGVAGGMGGGIAGGMGGGGMEGGVVGGMGGGGMGGGVAGGMGGGIVGGMMGGMMLGNSYVAEEGVAVRSQSDLQAISAVRYQQRQIQQAPWPNG
jgi:hypothetical protein